MTQFEFAKLACRVIAVYLVAEGVIYVGSALGEAIVATLAVVHGYSGAALNLLGDSVVVSILYGGVGAALWVWAGALAGKMVGDSAGPITARPDAERVLLPVALSAVGAFAFISEARSVAGDVGYAMMPLSARYSNLVFWTPRLLGHSVGLALSLWFIFSSRGISRIIHWARTAGDKSGEHPAPPLTCSRCGHILLDQATRCPECGEDVATAPAPGSK